MLQILQRIFEYSGGGSVDRRTFGKLAGFGTIGAVSPLATAERSLSLGQGSDPSAPPHEMAQVPSRPVDWPSRTFRRLLVDTHVPDWDDALMASFHAEDYVSTIAAAGFQSLMQYANSHAGLCFWPTKTGQPHRNMKGRDYFGEVMEQCKRRGLHRIAYYSLVYDDWAYQEHPEWRMMPADYLEVEQHSRTGTVCPNSPYKEHAIACIRELVAAYDFQAIYFDMTFWPTVCYCPHCIERYWKEQGSEPPHIVNWKDPRWRTFQRSREKWMREFALAATAAAKQTRPIGAYHQFGTFFAPWGVAVSLEQNEASDCPAGDFYGGAAQFSIVCKAFQSLTGKQPFEFQTSRTLNLTDFETTKPYEQMALESLIPTIHSAACMTIDAIKPSGELNHRVYQYLSQINAIHDGYEAFLGGDMLADVAIYFDKNSVYDPGANGKAVTEATRNFWGGPLPHRDAAVGAARCLREAHIPFGLVTNITLDQLNQYRAVILPSVLEMTADQSAIFREFVRNGGRLYASGVSSLAVPGEGEERFLLEDVLGVRFGGTLGGRATYITPRDKALYDTIWPQENLSFAGPMVKVEAAPGAEILATVTLPFVDPEAGNALNSRFAQIHSNPPASQPGDHPGIVVHAFGRGKTVWIAAPYESRPGAVDASLFQLLLRRILDPPYKFEADTDDQVEVTLFHQKDRKRLLAGMLNLQVVVPTIPVAATLRVQVPPGASIRKVSLLPEQKPLIFTRSGPYVSFRVPEFKLISMALVEYA